MKKARRLPHRSARSLTPTAMVRARRLECLAGQTLLAVARQRKEFDALRCETVLEHLDTAFVIRAALQQALAPHGLTELQFGVLVALFARDPEPVAPADLADYTAVSRAAITDALVHLETCQLITRARDVADRRVFQVQLSVEGQRSAERALVDFLGAAGKVARHVDADQQRNLLSGYARLQQGASEAA